MNPPARAPPAAPKVAPASREAIPPGSADPTGTSAVCAVDAELRTVFAGVDMIVEPLNNCSSICSAEGSPAVTGLPSAEQIEEQLLSGSTIMSTPAKTVRSSASTAHTADVPVGSALPGGIASRDAGATLGAAEATRAGGFIPYDGFPSRVAPHLVVVSQPRSAYTEQFRSLRTRILEAGERLDMRAIVITSAGVAEGKTLTALKLAWLLAQT